MYLSKICLERSGSELCLKLTKFHAKRKQNHETNLKSLVFISDW